MKRVWATVIPAVGENVLLPEEEVHHLVRVRRIEKGTAVEIVDGKGGLAVAKVMAVGKKSLELRVSQHLRDNRESNLTTHLCLALPQQKTTFDSLIPGLVQLGLQHIHLVETEFSGRWKWEARVQQRMQTIARQALKQSGRLTLPQIHQPKALSEVIKTVAEQVALKLVFHPKKDRAYSAPSLPSRIPSLALLLGPEGGFSEREWEQARENDWAWVDLGPRILRLETAAIGACFWAQARFGDFGF